MSDREANVISHDEQSERATLEHCPEGAIGHRFTAIDTRIKGYGAFETCVIEQCELCGNIRIDRRPELLGEVNDE